MTALFSDTLPKAAFPQRRHFPPQWVAVKEYSSCVPLPFWKESISSLIFFFNFFSRQGELPCWHRSLLPYWFMKHCQRRESCVCRWKLLGNESVDLDDHHKPEFRRVFSSSIIENGHQSSSGQAKASHELTSCHVSDSSPEAHAPAVTLQMPHLPVTAVTRISEKFSGETMCSTGTTNASAALLGQSKSKNVMAGKPSNQSVKAWNSSTVRTMSSSAAGENTTSVTKSVSTVSYGTSSGTKTGESATDSYCNVTPSSRSSPPTVHRQVERRRELVRSQTLPRTLGTQARKALFEKFEHDGGRGRGESRAKLKRSQSFGVASASSIKQILLDWCRSKTIGYKHIDLQNFSSSWNDGMAFCALVHSFFPEAFDYNKLDPANRKQNFELAFTMAEKMAHCDRLIEVDDMMVMGHKPDPMCVFTYVQSLYNHLRRFE
ncbi:smoothelin-like protein 2 isoform X2 [Balearica regulorum gibbericeps]|uniref:smoothelin-like protein 2 isoform X2 n=1 Tax=Balearica regulorum gibbericeps TaxID=100784 RepID=UPI003F63994F